jgi:hypothetical protein
MVAEAMFRTRGIPCPRDHPDRLPVELANRFGDLLARDDALGWFFQAINQPALRAAYRATARTGRKFASSEIPAVTQLFTPRWVVEFLLHNTLGRLWRQMHPDSKIRFSWMCDQSSLGLIPCIPCRLISGLDPACGTINLGLEAIEMFQEN